VQHAPQAGIAVASSAREVEPARSRQRLAAEKLPPQPHFGLPRPTKEELLMLRFAAENPEEAARLAQSQSEPYAPIVIQPLANDPIVTKPIEIKPITIEPIQISSLNPSN